MHGNHCFIEEVLSHNTIGSHLYLILFVFLKKANPSKLNYNNWQAEIEHLIVQKIYNLLTVDQMYTSSPGHRIIICRLLASCKILPHGRVFIFGSWFESVFWFQLFLCGFNKLKSTLWNWCQHPHVRCSSISWLLPSSLYSFLHVWIKTN